MIDQRNGRQDWKSSRRPSRSFYFTISQVQGTQEAKERGWTVGWRDGRRGWYDGGSRETSEWWRRRGKEEKEGGIISSIVFGFYFSLCNHYTLVVLLCLTLTIYEREGERILDFVDLRLCRKKTHASLFFHQHQKLTSLIIWLCKPSLTRMIFMITH